MKISFKSNIEFNFETTKKTKKRRHYDSKIKSILKWLLEIVGEYIITEFILKRLVALIIKVFMNGSFYYFYNRFFCFEVKNG